MVYWIKIKLDTEHNLVYIYSFILVNKVPVAVIFISFFLIYSSPLPPFRVLDWVVWGRGGGVTRNIKKGCNCSDCSLCVCVCVCMCVCVCVCVCVCACVDVCAI